MINDNLILFILSIVLIYVFDHKIIPTLAIIVLNLIEIYLIVVINSSTMTQTDSFYVFLYTISLLYAAFMMLAAPTEKNGNYDVVQ